MSKAFQGLQLALTALVKVSDPLKTQSLRERELSHLLNDKMKPYPYPLFHENSDREYYGI